MEKIVKERTIVAIQEWRRRKRRRRNLEPEETPHQSLALRQRDLMPMKMRRPTLQSA